jgi:uncharacterized repeat protein (TIGR02543 family)
MRTGRNAFYTILLIIGILSSFSVKQAAAASFGGANKPIIVRFDVNGGEGEVSDIVVSNGETYGELPEVTRENYIFQGWYTFRSGGSKVFSDTKIIRPISHTLYARWKGEPDEITLDANGGSLKKTTARVYFGSKYLRDLPTPTRVGYDFAGWYTEPSDGEKITYNSIYNETSEKILYAHWTEKQIKITFIAFNGEDYVRYVPYGMIYGELPEPKREGYTFGGWYKYEDYTNEKAAAITADTVVSDVVPVKLLARWNKDRK